MSRLYQRPLQFWEGVASTLHPHPSRPGYPSFFGFTTFFTLEALTDTGDELLVCNR